MRDGTHSRRRTGSGTNAHSRHDAHTNACTPVRFGGLTGQTAGDQVYGLCCPLPVKLSIFPVRLRSTNRVPAPLSNPPGHHNTRPSRHCIRSLASPYRLRTTYRHKHCIAAHLCTMHYTLALRHLYLTTLALPRNDATTTFVGRLLGLVGHTWEYWKFWKLWVDWYLWLVAGNHTYPCH